MTEAQKRRSPEQSPQPHRAKDQKQQRQFTSPINELLSRLDRVKPGSTPGTWLASCPTPAHVNGDRSRGLSVRETDDGRVLIHCFGGCHVSAIVSALGLELSDLFPPPPTDHPHQAPHRGFTGKPARVPKFPTRAVLEGMATDLRVCSLAFSDMAHGRRFNPHDAASISRLASHLADELREVLQ